MPTNAQSGGAPPFAASYRGGLGLLEAIGAERTEPFIFAAREGPRSRMPRLGEGEAVAGGDIVIWVDFTALTRPCERCRKAELWPAGRTSCNG